MKPMIIILTILMILFGLAVPVLAQDPPEDPFGGGFPLNYDAEIFTMGTQNDYLHGWVFDWFSELDSVVQVGEGSFPESYQCGEKRDIAAADFDGDFVDELVVAWNRTDGGVFVAVATIEPTTLDPEGWYPLDPPIPSGVLYETDTLADLLGGIRVVAGNFYDDPAMEFVLAYLAADSTVTLSVFEVDTITLIPEKITSISDQSVNTELAQSQRLDKSSRFDVTTGDFDGDGFDEIILVANDPAQSPETDVMIATYDYDTSGHAITPIAKLPLTANSSLDNTCLRRLMVEAGNFDADTRDEIAVMHQWADTTEYTFRIGTVHVLKLNPAMTSIDYIQNEALPSIPSWNSVNGIRGGIYIGRTMTTYNNDLIVAGSFNMAGPISVGNVARWNGSDWLPVGEYVSGGEVEAAIEFDGDLILGGDFTSAAPPAINPNRIVRWDGSAFHHMGTGMINDYSSPVVRALTIYDGKLIAGGNFIVSGCRDVAQWDGSQWQPLGTGLDDHFAVYWLEESVSALAVYDGDLIMAGGFISAEGSEAKGIARWNGSSWQALGGGLERNDGWFDLLYMYDMIVHDGELIVSGAFDRAGGSPASSVAAWNGSSWRPLNPGSELVAYPKDMVIYNGNVTAGGGICSLSVSECFHTIYQWNGSDWYSDWLDMGMEFYEDPLSIRSLTVYDGDLIVAGDFDSVTGNSVNNIARWDGSEWHKLGLDIVDKELPFDLEAGNIDRNDPTDTIITDELFITACRGDAGEIEQYVKGYGFDTSSVPATLCMTFDTSVVATPSAAMVNLNTSRRTMAVGDVTGEGWIDLNLLLSGDVSGKRIGVYELYPSSESVCTLDSVAMRGLGSAVGSELVLPDVDTFTVTIGPPMAYEVDSIIQPLAIINAPPVHYDILDDTIWDVSKRYPIDEYSQWDTYVEYYNSAAWQITMVSEMYRDWGVSKGLEAWMNWGGFAVSSYLEQKYGERFSEQGGYSDQITIGQTITARDDDQIYAVVVDYDILEYPVFRNGTLVGHIVIASPHQPSSGWDKAKNYKYVFPNHEVDNVLSYPRREHILDNPLIASGIIGNATDFFTMQPGSGSEWFLGHQTFEQSSVTESWDLNLDYGVSAGIRVDASVDLGIIRWNIDWGFMASLNGSYGKGQVSTFSTSFSETDSLHVQMGLINSAGDYSGNRRYKLTPYAYWANNGALVIDYATEPEKNEVGEPPTWWQIHYSNPDPAFILPRRFDNEKWGTPDPEEIRHQTKEIFFYPTNPAPGDSLAITARVHNFGLANILEPVAVSFYIGDPDFYGEILKDKNTGDSIFYTRDTLGVLVDIDAQGNAFASMVWQVPDASSISDCQRIWAVIDPLDSISPEVHDNGDWATNNKGWILLRLNTDRTCVDTDGDGYADPAYRCNICPMPGFDNCPTVPNEDQADNNGDGIGDACQWVCGDANNDQGVNVGDAVYLLNYVFRSSECATNPPIGCPPDYLSAGDANGDTNVNIGDVVYLNNHIFSPSQCDINPPIGCPPTCGS